MLLEGFPREFELWLLQLLCPLWGRGSWQGKEQGTTVATGSCPRSHLSLCSGALARLHFHSQEHAALGPGSHDRL